MVMSDGSVRLVGKEVANQQVVFHLAAVQISCGDNHTAVLMVDGSVNFIGSNYFGQSLN